MLTSVHITNFRSCKDVKLEGLGAVLGLVGRNGAGKTTILRAIEWCARTALLGDGFVRAFSEIEPAGGRAEPGVALELSVEEQIYRYEVRRWFREGVAGERSKVVHDEESLSIRGAGGEWTNLLARMDENINFSSNNHVGVGLSTAAMPALASMLPDGDPLQLHLRAVMDALRRVRYYLGHGVLDPSHPSGLDIPEPSGPIPEAAYERWVADLDGTGALDGRVLLRLIHAHERTPELFAELQERMGPDGLDLIKNIQVQIIGEGRRYFDVWFETAVAGRPLTLEQLSGGTRQVLYLMAGVLFDRSSVMLVEQPEDGIHPALLEKVIDVLRVNADPLQIIFASHSPTVLRSLRPEGVRLVEMRGGQTVARALTEAELEWARGYVRTEGTLADFLELIQEG